MGRNREERREGRREGGEGKGEEEGGMEREKEGEKRRQERRGGERGEEGRTFSLKVHVTHTNLLSLQSLKYYLTIVKYTVFFS